MGKIHILTLEMPIKVWVMDKLLWQECINLWYLIMKFIK